jgi:hypothetical protein
LEALVTITSSSTNGWQYGESPQKSNVLISMTTTIADQQLWNGPPHSLRPGTFTQQLVDFDALRDRMEEERRDRERRERPPSHWWLPDKSGHVCGVCDWDNIYRGVRDAHPPLIKEDPEPEDWWDQLGAA